MKLLLVEDNRQLADQLADALGDQHYVVDVARDGEEGWDLVSYGHYDVVMLDVTLPKLDGVSLCRKLRANGYQTPILMLTGRTSSSDKVTGLDAGADDYMAKPVVLNELTARLRALSRRNHKELTPVLEQGKLRLDPCSCQVTYDGMPVKLSPKEYLMLELFLRNSQRIYSRKAILDQLWGLDADLPGEDTVKAHIKGLRQRLRVVGVENLIQSVYGLGYRLNPEYEAEMAQAAQAPPASPSVESPTAARDQAVTENRVLVVTHQSHRAEKLQSALRHWSSQAIDFRPFERLEIQLQQWQPQMLVIDLTQAEMEGLRLCQSIRRSETWHWLPIVALVPADDGDIVRQAFQMGVDDCLSQPIAVSDLQQRVTNRFNRIAAISHLPQSHRVGTSSAAVPVSG